VSPYALVNPHSFGQVHQVAVTADSNLSLWLSREHRSSSLVEKYQCFGLFVPLTFADEKQIPGSINPCSIKLSSKTFSKFMACTSSGNVFLKRPSRAVVYKTDRWKGYLWKPYLETGVVKLKFQRTL